jgi:hypothetical protein
MTAKEDRLPGGADMPISHRPDDNASYVLSLPVDQWLTVLGTMDNETDTEAVEGDPRNVVEVGQSVMQTIWDYAYGSDQMPLPGHSMITIELTGRQCGLVTEALAHWAQVGDDLAQNGVDEDGSAEREALEAIESQLSGD